MSQPRVTPQCLAHFLAPDRTVSFWDQMAAQPRARTARICPPPFRSLSDFEPRKRQYSRRTFERVRADALRGAQ